VPKPQWETASLTLGTHQESGTYVFVFAPGCAVAPNSTGGQTRTYVGPDGKTYVVTNDPGSVPDGATVLFHGTAAQALNLYIAACLVDPNSATIATGSGFYPASAFKGITSIGDISNKWAQQMLTYIANNPGAKAQAGLASATTSWYDKSANMLEEEAALFAISVVGGVPTPSMYPDLISSSEGQGYLKNSNSIPALDAPNLPGYATSMGLTGPVYWANFHDHYGTGTLDASDAGWAAVNGLTIVRNNNTLYFAVGMQRDASGKPVATLYSGPLSILNMK
jgi:hypothetical protein